MEFDITNQADYDGGLAAYNIQQQVMEQYARGGFSIPNAPQQMVDGQVQPYRGEIPENLTESSDDQLTQYMNMLSLWLDYVGTQQTLADMAHKESLAQLDFAESTIRLTYKTDNEGKKRTAQERDDLVQTDIRYISRRSTTLYMETYLALVANRYRAASQHYKVISRRVTQRGQEIDRGTRNEGAAHGHQGTPSFPGRRV